MSDLINKLKSLRGSAHDVGLAVIAEIERLRAECLRLNYAEAQAMSVVLSQEGQIERLRSVLMELRARYHAAGRRPEECYEMSMIDEVLKGEIGVLGDRND